MSDARYVRKNRAQLARISVLNVSRNGSPLRKTNAAMLNAELKLPTIFSIVAKKRGLAIQITYRRREHVQIAFLWSNTNLIASI